MTIFFSSIYIISLWTVYKFCISNTWLYMGFENEQITFTRIVLIIFVNFIILHLFRKKITKNYIILLFWYVYFIPLSIITSYLNTGFYVFYFAAMSFILIVIFANLGFVVPSLSAIKTGSILPILIVPIIILIAFQLRYIGFSSLNLNIFRVYEFRADAASALPAIFGYILSPVTKILIPAMAVIAIVRRSLFLLAITCIATILVFGLSHHKSVLVAPIVAVAMYALLTRRKPYLLIAFSFAGLALVALAEWIIVSSTTDDPAHLLVNGLLIRRGLFVPALLDTFYIDFFAERAKMYWSTSTFSLGLVNNPYDRTAPFLIGLEYFGREGMSANTGIIGSGFSHAGVIGIAIYSIFLGLSISYINKCAKYSSHAYVTSVSIFPLMGVLTSTDFTTALLTHGFLFLLIFLMLSPAEVRSRQLVEA